MTPLRAEKVKLFTSCSIAALLAIAAYYDIFIWFYGRYVASDSYYSHGFLIPLVSGFLVWSKKRDLRSSIPKYSSGGLWIISFALLLHITGTLVHFYFISGTSLFFFILGTTLFLYGKNITKKILFPLIFLIFMIPLPLPIISAILFPMKVFVVKVSSQIIRMIEIPIYFEGFNVHLSKGTLLIGNPCSGLRSLIAFLAMSTLIGYLKASSVKKWILILLLSIPIGFFSNIVRTVSLILVANRWGTEASSPDHWFHDFSGMAVFAVGLAMLLGLGRILEWKSLKTVS